MLSSTTTPITASEITIQLKQHLSLNESLTNEKFIVLYYST